MGRARSYKPNIPPWAWIMWARSQADGWPRIGWPKQQPFYQPARLSKIDVVEDETPRSPPPTEKEMAIVERLTEAVAKYRVQRPSEVRCLVVFMGAYPDSLPDLEDRCRESGILVSSCRRGADRAKRGIDVIMGGDQ